MRLNGAVPSFGHLRRLHMCAAPPAPGTRVSPHSPSPATSHEDSSDTKEKDLVRDKYRTLHFVAILVNTTWFLAVCCTAGSSILVTPWFLSAIGVIFIAVGSSGAARYPPPWIGLTGSKGTEDEALRTWFDDSSLGCVYRVPAVAVTLAMLWRLTLTFLCGLFNMMFDQPMCRCEFPSGLHSLHMHALPAPRRPPSARSGYSLQSRAACAVASFWVKRPLLVLVAILSLHDTGRPLYRTEILCALLPLDAALSRFLYEQLGHRSALAEWRAWRAD